MAGSLHPQPNVERDIVIRRISPPETAPIRHGVLWPSTPLSAQLLPFDTVPTTLHFGAYLSPPTNSPSWTPADLIGCLTITNERYLHSFPKHLALADGLEHHQLHKFAVLHQYHGQGVGRKLLLESIRLLKEHVGVGVGLFLHFDARETQIGFYSKLGFEVLKEERFVKRGPTGDGPPVNYVRMGRVFDTQSVEGDEGRAGHGDIHRP